MAAQVDFATSSDRDFVRALIYAQYVNDWSSMQTYIIDDVVKFDGVYWRSKLQHTNITPGSDDNYWVLIDAPGFDLTGSIIKLQARNPVTSQVAPIALDNIEDGNGGIIMTNAVAGRFTVRISQASLLKVPAGSYTYSLIQTRADGIKDCIMFGTITHTVGPTR